MTPALKLADHACLAFHAVHCFSRFQAPAKFMKEEALSTSKLGRFAEHLVRPRGSPLETISVLG